MLISLCVDVFPSLIGKDAAVGRLGAWRAFRGTAGGFSKVAAPLPFPPARVTFPLLHTLVDTYLPCSW